MPVYSVNRRRAIVLLVLTSVLFLTLDVRGNPVVNRVRTAFSWMLSPFVTAGDVIATPVKNVWHGATDYQDVKRENEELREQIARQRGDQLTARAIVSDYQELLTLNGLIANYPRVTARVVGGRTGGNFRQTVDIDRGTEDGILVGMAVINSAGLVGKITFANRSGSVVLLATDQEYAIECKVVGSAVRPDPDSSDSSDSSDGTDSSDSTDEATDNTDGASEETTPSGENVEDLATTTSPSTTTTTTTTILDPDASETDDPGSAATTTTLADASGTGTTSTSSTTTTTTTTPPLIERETGGCGGRGGDKLPVMRFVTENPQLGSIEIGDVISTAGGPKSLAPPDLIIGTVINKIVRASSAGPLLEIELAADLDHLSLVQIVQTRPTSEVPG